MQLNRQNKNILTNWWWTIDKPALAAIFLIIAFGALMVTTSSQAVAERIGMDSFFFVRKQLVYLSASVVILFTFSLFSPLTIRRIAVIGFASGILMLIAVLLFGNETNGAKRWIFIGSMSIQPSEFLKPLFIVVTGWMLSEAKRDMKFKGFQISIVLYIILASLLLLQPDFGMFVIVSSVWGGQLFIAGMPIMWVVGIVMFGIFATLAAYSLFPHVAFRIDSFLDTQGNFQVRKSLEAFINGGLTGRGPGEGTVKQSLPDSHTDFIFAVVGEELGATICLLIVCLYAFIVLRGFVRMINENNLFHAYAVSGLLMQFGMQAMVNMGVALNLLPTKGMTLPFISYGGSSMLAIAMAMGMMLALTRRRYGDVLINQKIKLG